MSSREDRARRVPTWLHMLDRALSLPRRLHGRIRRAATVGRFGSHGDHFVFDPFGHYTYENIHVGDHVDLGASPTILSPHSEIRIGNHVMLGPHVTIRGGNHRFDVVGRYMDSMTEAEKRPQDDIGVVIGDDVWIGGNVTILDGVTIGRGSVVGAASVVTKDVPPYSIVAGMPARVISRRFMDEEIIEHEALLRGAALAH